MKKNFGFEKLKKMFKILGAKNYQKNLRKHPELLFRSEEDLVVLVLPKSETSKEIKSTTDITNYLVM